MNFAIQRHDQYKESEQAHTLAERDYKSATDLIVGGELGWHSNLVNSNLKKFGGATTYAG